MELPLFVALHRETLLARLLCRKEVVGLTLRAEGRLGLVFEDGVQEEVDVDASTTIFVSLIVLRYRRQGLIESLVLPHAATGKAAHRCLRIWLRCRARTGVSAGA